MADDDVTELAVQARWAFTIAGGKVSRFETGQA
jgi:hypothetical protein